MSDRDDRADDLTAASGDGAEGPEPTDESSQETSYDGASVEGDPDAEAAAWRDIVEHYGDRALLDDDTPDAGLFEQRISIVSDGGTPELDPDDERYVPPPPPPLPRPAPARLLAWIGVLGAPVAVLVLITVTKITGNGFPGWVIGVLVAAFLGGFAYLLLTMPREPRDPWDDGARV